MIRPISRFSANVITHKALPLVFQLHISEVTEFGSTFSIPRLTNYEFYALDESEAQVRDITFPLLVVREEPSDLFQDIYLREESDYEFIIAVPLMKEEILSKRRQNVLFPFNNLKLKPYISFNHPDIWQSNDRYTYVSGRLRIKSFAGILRFVFDQELTDSQIIVEVFSHKINYEDDFRALLIDIANHHSELVMQLDQPTEMELQLDDEQEASKQVKILHLRRLLEAERLPQAVEEIIRRPHQKKTYEVEWTDLSQTTHVFSQELASNANSTEWHKGGRLANRFRGYTPVQLPYEEVDYTFDTNENRFVKFILEEFENLIEALLSNIPKGYESSVLFLRQAEDTISGILQQPFFRQIGKFTTLHNSMVLQKKSGYKELFSYALQYELGVKLENQTSELDSLHADLRPIHALYEYWCFFKLLEIMQTICDSEIDVETLISSKGRGFSLNLKRNVELSIPFSYKGLSLKLFYNRDFKNHQKDEWDGTYDGGLYHPDFSLQINKNEQIHWIHFDSKYKVDNNKLKKMLIQSYDEESHYEGGAFKRNDIHTAHAYKDAILGSRGVYILYPDVATDEFVFRRQPETGYSLWVPSIGALPLRPGETSVEQIKSITKFLVQLLDAINANQQYVEERGFV